MSERELFLAALDIENFSDREAFLAKQCAGNPEMLQRLRQLLLAKSAAGDFLESPAVGVAADATRTFGEVGETGSYLPTTEAEGTVIAGRYKLRQQIGEGGMGTVWMADQTEPVKRKVAVKLIRVERGQSKTILARFEAERQAIALMDHPHIAKLLDAGTTDTGSPFFVMELVKGIPLNEFCDAHKLTIPERLNLFTQICSAVQHAHQKGIIHRDLKPSNVLVESHDGKPVPKVIDFGLAKATTGLQLTEQSMFTAFGSVMGTPLYMAPEQASFNAVDVDTRADVYALGVILYELLTGTTPITRDSLKKAALDEMLRLVREQEAPSPSSRLSSSDNAPSVAASRQSEPAKLGRFVKGELDWIVLKALSKDRDRRYETANGFARDIERFLNHEPVQAGPPSTRYRLQKFVRRNRPQVIAASLVFVALVAGVIGTSIGMAEAKKQERLARDAERNESLQRIAAEAERDEKEKARKQAVIEKERADREKAIAEAVKNFVTQDIFNRAGDRSLGLASDIKAGKLLEEAAKTVGEKFKGHPEIELAVRQALANGFNAVGNLAAEKQQLERVLELARKHLPKDDLVMLWATGWLAGRTLDNPSKAIALARESFEGHIRVYGKEHIGTLGSASSLLWIMEREGVSHQEADPLCDEYLAISRRSHGDNIRTTLNLMARKAMLLKQAGKTEEALSMLHQVRDSHIKLTTDPWHPDATWHVITRVLIDLNRYQEAIPLIQEDITRLSKVFGADHAEVHYRRSSLAEAYWLGGEYLQAGPVMFDVTESDRRINGPRSKWGLETQRRGVIALSRVSRLDIACIRAEVWAGSDKPDELANAVSLLNMVIQHTKDDAEANKLRDRAMQYLQRAVDRSWDDTERLVEFPVLTTRPEFQMLTSKLGKGKPSAYPSAVAGLAGALRASGKFREAIDKYAEAIRLQEAEVVRFPDNEQARVMLGNFYSQLGHTHKDAGNSDKALRAHADAYQVRLSRYAHAKSDQKAESANLAASSLHNQAQIHLAEKRYEKAAELFKAAAETREKVLAGLPEVHDFRYLTGVDWDWLGRTWVRAGRWTDAEAPFRKALEVREAIVAANFNNSGGRADLDWSRRQLAATLVELGKFPEARDIYRKNLDLYRKTNDGSVHDALAYLGAALLRTGDWQEAEVIMKECFERREKTNPEGWPTFNAYSMYGGALLGQKRFAEAELYLLKGYNGMREREQQIQQTHLDRLYNSLDRLIELYTATKKPDEVKRYKELRAKYPLPTKKN